MKGLGHAAVLSWNDRLNYVNPDPPPTPVNGDDFAARMRLTAELRRWERSQARAAADGHPLSVCGEAARPRLGTSLAVLLATVGLAAGGVYLFGKESDEGKDAG